MTAQATAVRWIGIGEQEREAFQSTTVNPDVGVATEGAPEWLVTNGLGGYASGTMTGLVTRRFHGYLVAALPAPRGRTMMLNTLRETLTSGGVRIRLCEQPDPESTRAPLAHLREFRLELGLPVWTYTIEDDVIEKRLVMPHRQNTIHITYERLAGARHLE